MLLSREFMPVGMRPVSRNQSFAASAMVSGHEQQYGQRIWLRNPAE